ncbi:DDRGK domain-containing protein 1 [Ctenocephalides felis]|uniref:DDRGK domain-containing protein 1 n=1 Tax=Ctenocephalides felis TaxID=7515 RepID=UPI000E6E367F|nr:DDRGK domain-containing protein 1 [Ctenocephalides felis]
MDNDILILAVIASVLFITSLILYLIKLKNGKKSPEPQQGEQVPVRRQQVVRNQRARLRANAAARLQDTENERQDLHVDDDNEEVQKSSVDFGDKMGAKKRAKLEAKAEKKAAREAEQKIREEKRKREAALDEERRKQEEQEQREEQLREEAIRKAKEEKEKREQEEYLAMKAAFSVEEEGFDNTEDGNENLLQEFVNYIKNTKVVVLEDLALHFRMKTQAAIDRITDLKKDGILTGVIDDRGKFIYISQKELDAVAKFIRQRGRVSIAELAEHSNNLISLEPIKA